jgi:hypothetical protein
MIGIGIFFSILGLGYLGWLLFSLYVYALPTIVGGIAGFAAYYSGAGGLGAFIVGFVVGFLTLVGGCRIRQMAEAARVVDDGNVIYWA